MTTTLAIVSWHGSSTAHQGLFSLFVTLHLVSAVLRSPSTARSDGQPALQRLFRCTDDMYVVWLRAMLMSDTVKRRRVFIVIHKTTRYVHHSNRCSCTKSINMSSSYIGVDISDRKSGKANEKKRESVRAHIFDETTVTSVHDETRMDANTVKFNAAKTHKLIQIDT